jgi:uncharacterized protein (DUF58 family)
MARNDNAALDPRLAAAVGDLRLRARLVVEGLVAGLHRSPLAGVAQEFVEHRPYRPGDEPRLVDWRAWAKTDRLYVKTYEEESDLRLWLVLDVSASMGYRGGGTGVDKLEYARTLAAALAYLTVRQGDNLGLAVFSAGLSAYLPPRRGPLQLGKVLKGLTVLEPGGGTDYEALVRELAGRAGRRGLFVIISDLWGEDDDPGASLAALAARRHELIALRVLDPDEIAPDFSGPLLLHGLEEDAELPVDAEALGRAYRERFAEHDARLAARLRAAGADYLRLSTADDFIAPLRRFLARRDRLRNAAGRPSR